MMQHRHSICAFPKVLMGLLAVLHIASCTGRMHEKSVAEPPAVAPYTPSPPATTQARTEFPQIHTNLHGMVSEFVRAMYQDSKGNFWFGTNTNGIIRYDGQNLENVSPPQLGRSAAVRMIVEDEAGNVWLATSEGLVRYDGASFTVYSTELGLPHEEIWGLTVDASGLIWVGTVGGVSRFDGKRFEPFLLPDGVVENPQRMLSDKLVFKLMEDRQGAMWLVTDGNGIFKYHQGAFTHLTKQNGLTDNSVADIFEDQQGNIWIGTFYGGVSRFDGKTFTHFTQEGIIQGVEAYNFCADKAGNIWFSAEGHGVYRYDGKAFAQFTTEDGLATNTVQDLYADRKGQVWCSTWQGISLFDGQRFVDAKDKEPWTN